MNDKMFQIESTNVTRIVVIFIAVGKTAVYSLLLLEQFHAKSVSSVMLTHSNSIWLRVHYNSLAPCSQSFSESGSRSG